MILWIILIAINLISLIFLAVTVWRIDKVYIKKFPLTESKYTLLFGKMPLQHMIAVYIIFIGFVAVSSIIFGYVTIV